MERKGLKEFLDSDEKFRKGMISELQKLKKETQVYDFMLPAEKEKINKMFNQLQNMYRSKQLF